MKNALIVLFLTAAGCASVPKETVLLSQEMSVMIANAKTAHINLLDEYERERRARIDDYMQSTLIPRFIKTMAKDGDLWGKTCAIRNTTDAAIELQGFVEVAAQRIAAKRKELTDALDLAMYDLREAVRVHYETLESANNAVTSNLQSIHYDQEITDGIKRRFVKEADKVLPLREVSQKLDKMMD